MRTSVGPSWPRLAQWSSTGFVLTGVGFFAALALLVVDTVTAMTVSETAISVVTVPSLLVLTLVALPGFYPYVADASPRLALAGVVAAVVSAATTVFMVVGSVALALLGVSGFTEEGPLSVGFLVVMFAMLASILLYALASLYSGEPSRFVGVLLLVIVTEPATTLFNDALGLDLGIALLYLTLGIAGVSIAAIGVSLRSVTDGTEVPAGSETAT